jgi:hypothetical protein
MNQIVDGQISMTHLSNSCIMPFDKQCCVVTNYWTSNQKGYNIKNKAASIPKAGQYKEGAHYFEYSLQIPIKTSQFCVNIKYGYIKSRYSTHMLVKMSKGMQTAKHENRALIK